jgi:hypothetical protein
MPFGFVGEMGRDKLVEGRDMLEEVEGREEPILCRGDWRLDGREAELSPAVVVGEIGEVRVGCAMNGLLL